MKRYLPFLPSYIVPPLIGLAAVFTFTRLLTPAEYGLYALTLSTSQLVISVMFSWLQVAVKRFFVESREGGALGALSVTVYSGYALMAAATVIIFVIVTSIADFAPDLRAALSFGVGLMLARSLSMIVKAFRVSDLDALRYGLMECGESVLGFVAATALVWGFHLGAPGLILGLSLGALLPVVLESSALRRNLRDGAFDRALMGRLFAFAAPITVGYALEYVMSSSDRFLIQYFLGPSAVGVYAAAYTLSERAISVVFQGVALVGYPLLMGIMSREGGAAARVQARANVELLLVLAVPAWAGFVVGAPQVAAVLTGPAFADSAAVLMPWIGSAVFLSCIRQHYIDHAFHLARRTDVYFYIAGIPAFANIALNLILLPRMGVAGAVAATVASYALALLISIVLSMRIFPMPFPLVPALKVAAASGIMAAVLKLAQFPSTALGLGQLVATGVAIYGLLALGLDLGGARATARKLAGRAAW